MFLTLFIFLICSYFFLKKHYKNGRFISSISGKKNVLLVLGSGGHTQEMIFMSQRMDFKKISRLYLVCSPCDKFSFDKFISHIALENLGIKKIPQIIKIQIPRTNRPEGNSYSN
jgi:hypothetical protein